MPESPRPRKRIRLRAYDYSLPGGYFVTIVTARRRCCLGEIVAGENRLSELGRLVAETWHWLATQYPYVMLDEFVVMPNHVHGILIIDGPSGSRAAATDALRRKPLGQLIGAFKSRSTKAANSILSTPGAAFWEYDFYDRVIRHERELVEIRKYIFANPMQWEADDENPQRFPTAETKQ